MVSLYSLFSPNAQKALRTRAGKAAIIGAAALVSLAVVAGCSQNSSSSQSQAANANDPVVARVNGTEIRQSDVAMAEEEVGSQLQGSPEQKREALIGYLTDVNLVAQAAEKQKVADTPEFKRREAFMRNKLLMGALLQANAKAAATDEEMHKVYDDAVKPMGAEEEVRARHILVESEDEAKAIAQQIKGGADFAELAKEKSKDPGSAKDGGDLGYFVKGNMVPEFADVAFKMYPGQVSNPVKTQFGWHIIKLEDKRSRQVPKFDDVKNQIEAFVTRRAQTEFVAQLREGAKIERLDRPATPPPPLSVLPPAEAPAPAAEPLTPAGEPIAPAGEPPAAPAKQ
jgi:peptidyl-prolyl cis-trans isomerase C